MSNLELSQILKVPGFQGPSLTRDDRLALLVAPPIKAAELFVLTSMLCTLILFARTIPLVRKHKYSTLVEQPRRYLQKEQDPSAKMG